MSLLCSWNVACWLLLGKPVTTLQGWLNCYTWLLALYGIGVGSEVRPIEKSFFFKIPRDTLLHYCLDSLFYPPNADSLLPSIR
jgi:hypothetical protein